MTTDVLATRLSVLTKALPMRILLVDDDELELELLADRIKSAGFQVTSATNGEQALAELAQQRYPVVITDWQMPLVDGIALTEALRSRGFDDTYVIMLTARGANVDYERGYLAGVDDYLTKKVPDAELFSRIYAAFNTIALRRSLQETQNALRESVSIDGDSGAFTPREMYWKLHSEIQRAQRYGRQLTIVVVNANDGDRGMLAAPVLRGLVQAMGTCLRAHVDWIGRLDAETGVSFAIVLPETDIVNAPAIQQRLLKSLMQHCTVNGVELAFRAGVAALDRAAGGNAQTDARDMLDVATRCLHCPGHTGDEQRHAVQGSIAGHLSIVCRHGYAVDQQCSLRSATATATQGANPA
jgi:two-component system, cell cycle response regulator